MRGIRFGQPVNLETTPISVRSAATRIVLVDPAATNAERSVIVGTSVVVNHDRSSGTAATALHTPTVRNQVFPQVGNPPQIVSLAASHVATAS